MNLNAYYDEYGKLIFEGGDFMLKRNEEELSRPSVDEVRVRYGEDTAEIYEQALNGKLTTREMVIADRTDETNEAVKALRGWNLPDLGEASQYFIREIELDNEE